MGHVSFVLRFLTGAIFTVAGVSKISDPIGFFSTLMQFQLFPDLALRFLAVYVPWLELVTGLCLLLGLMHRSAGLVFAVLNVLFSFSIMSVIVRGIEVDCGCFGLLGDALGLPDAADKWAVLRNLLFIAMGLGVFFIKESKLSLQSRIRGALEISRK